MWRFVCVAVLAALVFTTRASAADGCENPKNSYDATYCFVKLFMAADDELNTAYQDLKQVLSKDQMEKLKGAQRAWIKYRNNACSSAGNIDVECNYKVNKSRVEALHDRLRECKTGHCRDDLLEAKEWEKTGEAPAAN